VAAKKTYDEGSMLGQWNSLVRRARIGRDHKAAALLVSSYANPDGSGIFLSPARYAVDLEVSYSTARRYLTWLRKVGLLEMTRAGNRRKHTASEYRLILGPDVMEHLEVLSPAAQKALADEMREAERDGSRGRAARMKGTDQRSQGMSVDEAPMDAVSDGINAHPEEALMAPINAQMAPDQRSPWMTYTPSRSNLSVEDHPSRADEEDLRTASHPSRVTPAQCPVHHIRLKPRTDDLAACPLCRAEQRGSRPPEPDPEPSGPSGGGTDPPSTARRAQFADPQYVAPVISLDSRRTA
jgi:hypothetical protein